MIINNIEETLQKVYDSEIHLRIGWMWDGGFDYSIGSTSNDLWGEANKTPIVQTGITDFYQFMLIVVSDIITTYPDSSFTVWFKSECPTCQSPLEDNGKCSDVGDNNCQYQS